ncbi:hypothetical protein BX661DRAFT_175898 [Kickxella alabastrina]|uniref:uncharacterized protein n=1 Tax=Kickxella alabastrina TaxID=61397 RepID=UPI00221F61AA|nr:uncharacterized protein BX661DRAFT_175898 [Kickxella alabastrina]KAI7834990.1 hypothetical protein BX661DRAFT_175898 [Kickxella alabastrina]
MQIQIQTSYHHKTIILTTTTTKTTIQQFQTKLFIIQECFVLPPSSLLLSLPLLPISALETLPSAPTTKTASPRAISSATTGPSNISLHLAPLDKSATLIPQLPTPSCALLQGRAVSLELASALDTRQSVQTMDRAAPTIAASHGLASMSTTNVPLDLSATTMMPALVYSATK